jgi:creatinine amidohydrolase
VRVWCGLDNEAIEVAGVRGDHAGRCETSQLWALSPSLVDMSRLAQGTTEEISHIMATGADAGQASRRLGEAIVASQVAWFGRKDAELLAAYSPPAQPASRTPGNRLGALTFGETERLWRAEVEPLFPTLTSLHLAAGQDPLDPASTWAPNQLSHVGLLESEESPHL